MPVVAGPPGWRIRGAPEGSECLRRVVIFVLRHNNNMMGKRGCKGILGQVAPSRDRRAQMSFVVPDTLGWRIRNTLGASEKPRAVAKFFDPA